MQGCIHSWTVGSRLEWSERASWRSSGTRKLKLFNNNLQGMEASALELRRTGTFLASKLAQVKRERGTVLLGRDYSIIEIPLPQRKSRQDWARSGWCPLRLPPGMEVGGHTSGQVPNPGHIHAPSSSSARLSSDLHVLQKPTPPGVHADKSSTTEAGLTSGFPLP